LKSNYLKIFFRIIEIMKMKLDNFKKVIIITKEFGRKLRIETKCLNLGSQK